jgi:hypothetical protein
MSSFSPKSNFSQIGLEEVHQQLGLLISGPHSLQSALSGGNEAECVRSERQESRC